MESSSSQAEKLGSSDFGHVPSKCRNFPCPSSRYAPVKTILKNFDHSTYMTGGDSGNHPYDEEGLTLYHLAKQWF